MSNLTIVTGYWVIPTNIKRTLSSFAKNISLAMKSYKNCNVIFHYNDDNILKIVQDNVLPELKYFFDVAAPNLILAGDICYYKHHNFLTFFEKINQLYENIFFIPGNHDYYAHYEIPEIGFEQIDFKIR